MRNLDGEMRQRFEPGKSIAIIVSLTSLAGYDRDYRPEMPRPQAPKMEIGELVTLGLNFLTQLVGHAFVGIHVEQDRAGVPDQAVRPTGNDASTDDASKRVHPKPPEGTGKKKANNDEKRYGGIRNHVDPGGTHVVVASRRSVRMFVFFENDGIILCADPHCRREGVRFRNLIARLQETAYVANREKLSRSIGTQSFDRRRLRQQNGAGCGSKPEARRHAVFKNFEHNGSGSGRDFMRLVMVMAFMRVAVTVVMVAATAQNARA